MLQFEEYGTFLSETSKERWLGGNPDRANQNASKNISVNNKNQYVFAQHGVLEIRK
jgi:hypothetical protein